MIKKYFLLLFFLFANFCIAQVANPASDLSACSNNSSGISCDFDFSNSIAEIIGTQDPANLVVTFHETSESADTNTDAIPVTGYCNITNPQTIYARLENSLTGMFSTTSFNLLVPLAPVLNQASPLEACDDEPLDQMAIFDLTSQESIITGNNPNIILSYYSNQSDLLNDIPIADPTAYQNVQSSIQTIFVRGTDVLSSCTNAITFNIRVNPVPTILNLITIEACDDDMDGFSVVDLFQIIPPEPGVIYSLHASEADAMQNINALSSPTTISVADANAFGIVTLYLRAVNSITGCVSVGGQPILVNCDVANRIIGNVLYDFNADGCDVSDYPAAYTLIETTNGTDTFNTFTQADGSYVLFVGEGSFTTSINASGLPNYFTSVPATATTNFTGLGNEEIVDFCLEQTNTINDITTSIYPLSAARPGFDVTYRIVYSNQGTTIQNGTITFEFDDTKLQFLTASEVTSATTSNSLTFNYTNLIPLESKIIDIDMNVFPPPTTNIDEVLNFTATINPITGDATPNDNVFNVNQTVIGSYDPNDIQVVEGPQVFIDDADNYLHYIIRFQNTGTASAINVRVDNVLDDKLDWTTMQLESLSDEGRVEIKNGNEVSFIFDDINLPDSTTDEPNSHGFITYKIKPKSNVILGDIISNTASIFFDFNPPIITNTVTTEFVEPLSVTEVNTNTFEIFPNPSSDQLFITGKSKIQQVIIYNIEGKFIRSFPVMESSLNTQLDISKLPQGFYFVKIIAEKKVVSKKIVKR